MLRQAAKNIALPMQAAGEVLDAMGRLTRQSQFEGAAISAV
jgi:hypothetical protein